MCETTGLDDAMLAAACIPETFFTVWHNLFQQRTIFGERTFDGVPRGSQAYQARRAAAAARARITLQQLCWYATGPGFVFKQIANVGQMCSATDFLIKRQFDNAGKSK